MEFDEMNTLTLKILESPKKVNAQDFMSIYNTVYQHCTQKTDVYVVKGKSVYDTLKKVITKYFEGLKPLSSLKAFNLFCAQTQVSIGLLTEAFSYLERYYIKSAINLRDGYTVDITTLVYNLGYTHYLSLYLPNIKDCFICEFDFQRKASKPKHKELNYASIYLRTFLLYNDLKHEYDDLLDRYFKEFYGFIKDLDVQSLVKITSREVVYFQRYFENTQRNEIQKLTYCATKKFKEVLDLFRLSYINPKGSNFVKDAGLSPPNIHNTMEGLVDRIIRNNLIEYFARLVYFMREEQAKEFVETCEILTKEELANIGEYKETILYAINMMVLTSCIPINMSKILTMVKDNLKKILSNHDHLSIFVELVEEIREGKCVEINSFIGSVQYRNITRPKLLDLVMKVIKLSYLHEKILKKIIMNIQLRLIADEESYSLKNNVNFSTNILNPSKTHSLDFYGTRDTESKCNDLTTGDLENIKLDKLLIASIEKNFGTSFVSWLKMGIDRFFQPISQTFAIANQVEDLTVDIRLITKGFWSFLPSELVLHPKLSVIENHLVKQCHVNLPKSKIESCYKVSPAIFSLNGFDFRVSTDVLSLIMYFLDCNSYDTIKNETKDPNFDDSVAFLLQSNILYVANGEYFVNNAFNQCDFDNLYKLLPHTTTAQPSFIDLFTVQFVDLEKERPNNSRFNHLEIYIEAFIIRSLKKNKKIEMEVLIENVSSEYGLEKEEVLVILQRLESKEYLKIENNSVLYIV